jgi:hypothetical protein
MNVRIDVVLVVALLAAVGVACGAPDVRPALTAALDGAAKPDGPPSAKDPDGRGTAVIRLNAESGEVCWELTVLVSIRKKPCRRECGHRRVGERPTSCQPSCTSEYVSSDA